MYRYISQRAQLIRSYYSGIGKTGIIIPAAFLVAVGIGLVMLGLVFYAREVFEAPGSRIGLLAGMWTVPYILGCLVVRPLFRRVLPRFQVVGSTAGMFVCAVAMQVVSRFEWLYLLNALYGLSISLFWPPLMGWLSADAEGRDLGRVVGRFNMSWCSGTLVSPYLCGWLSERDPRLPLVVASYIFVGTAAFVLGAAYVLPRIRADRDTETVPDGGDGLRGEETVLRFPAWVGLFACFFGFGVLGAVFPLHARDVLQLDKSTIGGLFFVRALLNTGGFYILGRAAFWHFRLRPMLLAQLAAALALAGLLFAHTPPVLALCFGGYGLAASMAYSSSIFHGASGNSNRAGRMALHEAVIAAGVMAGATSGGAIFEHFSEAHVYGVCIAVLVGSAVVQGVLFTYLRRRQGSTDP